MEQKNIAHLLAKLRGVKVGDIKKVLKADASGVFTFFGTGSYGMHLCSGF